MATPESYLLALNSGSSSLKLGLFCPAATDVQAVASGSAEGIGRGDGSVRLQTPAGQVLYQHDHVLESQAEALQTLVGELQRHFPQAPVAVGHRFVHGGPHLRTHQVITPEVRTQLEAAVHFAPLHLPQSLRLLDHASALYPTALQIACFDTAFHRNLPAVAQRLPLPEPLFQKGILRYGFHGLSYESVVQRLRSKLPERAVFAHLGSGSSLVAVRHGSSVDTTMGLTPTGGVPMSTRSGDLDPGVLLYLLRNEGATADSLEAMLNGHAGLAALAGGEADMQALLGRSDDAAALAVDAFCLAVAKAVGAYAAVLGGLDLLVFTGGIGEHSAKVRERVCGQLGFLQLPPDGKDTANLRILPAEEEAQIARHCRTLMGGAG